MKLLKALAVKKGDLIAFVGAGGKTTSMLLLADELVSQGFSVIVTTTTKMAEYEMRSVGSALAVDELDPPLLSVLANRIKTEGKLFLYNSAIPGKVKGFTADFIDHYLTQIEGVDVILIEADGSRQLPLKAAYDHEPVLPNSTPRIVHVVGLNAIGDPMDEGHVYGLPRIKEFLRPDLPVVITPEWVCAILLHPELGLRGYTEDRPITILLNRCDEQNTQLAQVMAQALLKDLKIHSVLLAALEKRESPIIERHQRVGIVLLAAGLSERMGTPKVLLPWSGESLIAHLSKQAVDSLASFVVVVAGEWKEEIATALRDHPLSIVHNPQSAALGMLSSMQVGIKAVSSFTDACMVMMGDLPFVSQYDLDQIIEAYFRGEGEIITPAFEGKRGHPVLFSRRFWPELLALGVGEMPRKVVMDHSEQVFELPMMTDAVIFDIDMPDDYQTALKRRDLVGRGK